jgi:hypothetical protein
VLRTGLIAAVLLTGSAAFLVAGRTATAAGPDKVQHVCSATDRQFIDVARANLAAVRLWGNDYFHGSGSAADVVSATKDAGIALDGTSPTDPSLATARRYFRSMFREYGRGVKAKERGAGASEHMYRAYSLGEYAGRVLWNARPQLRALGCDVSELL